jgi:hypothetical protein
VVERYITDESLPKQWQSKQKMVKYWLPMYPSFEDPSDQMIFEAIYGSDGPFCVDQVIGEVVNKALT